MMVYENVTNSNHTMDPTIIFFALSGDFPLNQAMTYESQLTMNSTVMTVPKNMVAHKIISCANVFTSGFGLLFLIPIVS